MWRFWRTWRAVARVGDLRAGGLLAIDLDGAELVLGRDGDRYFAIERRCPHRGADLAAGRVSHGLVTCPQHGWRFATTPGRPPPDEARCLVSYAVRVVDDRIEIDPTPRGRRA